MRAILKEAGILFGQCGVKTERKTELELESYDHKNGSVYSALSTPESRVYSRLNDCGQKGRWRE